MTAHAASRAAAPRSERRASAAAPMARAASRPERQSPAPGCRRTRPSTTACRTTSAAARTSAAGVSPTRPGGVTADARAGARSWPRLPRLDALTRLQPVSRRCTGRGASSAAMHDARTASPGQAGRMAGSELVDYDRVANLYKVGRAMPDEALDRWGRAVRPHLPTGGRVRVADLGAGTGIFAAAWPTWGASDVVAVEVSAAMAAHGRGG